MQCPLPRHLKSATVVYKMTRLDEPIKLSLITCDVATAYLLHSSSDQMTICMWEKVRADLTGCDDFGICNWAQEKRKID